MDTVSSSDLNRELSMHIMSREEVARELRITPEALTNRISRGLPHPPFVQMSPRRRLWLRDAFYRWLEEQQRSGAGKDGPFERLGLKAPKRT